MRVRGVQATQTLVDRPAMVDEWYVLEVDDVLAVTDEHMVVLVNADDATRRFMHGADVRIPLEAVRDSSSALGVGERGELHLGLEFVRSMGWFS